MAIGLEEIDFLPLSLNYEMRNLVCKAKVFSSATCQLSLVHFKDWRLLVLRPARVYKQVGVTEKRLLLSLQWPDQKSREEKVA